VTATDPPTAEPQEQARPDPRVEQDDRELLLVELGAARERVAWLQVLNERYQNEAAEAAGRAQANAELARRAQSQVVAWRLATILTVGVFAIQVLARMLPSS